MYAKITVVLILALMALATALVLCPRKAKCRLRLGVVLQLVVLTIGLVIYGVAFILLLVWVLGFTAALGPIAGALISAIAVMSYDTATHYFSTSELELSLGVGGHDPGLDVEVFEFEGPPPCGALNAKVLYRISAMIFNRGDSIVKDAKASLTIKVRDGRGETYYLRDVLISKNLCSKGYLVNANYLVNEYNPHVIGEELSWALPEKAIPAMSACSQHYRHITSISPGQRSRLLIFDFVNVANMKGASEGEVGKLNNAKYIITPYSEYGDPGPRRACLRLSDNYELIFEVTVHGEGSRRPLCFALCITAKKLRKVEGALNKLRQGGGPSSFGELLDALSDLRCDGRCK